MITPTATQAPKGHAKSAPFGLLDTEAGMRFPEAIVHVPPHFFKALSDGFKTPLHFLEAFVHKLALELVFHADNAVV